MSGWVPIWVASGRLGCGRRPPCWPPPAASTTHRGATFGLGLLCAAAGSRRNIARRRGGCPARLGEVVVRPWAAEIARGPSRSSATPRRRSGAMAGGARTDAAGGFRSVYEIGWPALCEGRSLQPGDPGAPSVQACFAQITAVCDTNLPHRGSAGGLRYASEAASSFLAGRGRRPGLAPAGRCRACRIRRPAPEPRRLRRSAGMTLFVDELESGAALR